MEKANSYAGIFSRFGALLIDGVVLLIVSFVFRMIIPSPALQAVLPTLTGFCYFTVLEGVAGQASLGKRLVRIYVAMMDGKKMSPLRSCGRYAVYSLPTLPQLSFSITHASAYAAMTANLKSMHDPAAMQAYMKQPDIVALNSSIMPLGLVIVGGYFAFYLLPMIFTKQKTALHDLVTSTRVYKSEDRS